MSDLDAPPRTLRAVEELIEVFGPEGIESYDAPARPSREDLAALAQRLGPRRLSLAYQLAGRLVGDLREEAAAFLATRGIEVAIGELEEIEERLKSGSARRLRHAATSTRWVLRAIADEVFPARATPFRDGFGVEHPVGEEKTTNRLLAFTDAYLRATLSPEEHQIFAAEVGEVGRWAASTPHLAPSEEWALRAYVRLVRLLAMVARAAK
jgi:hypothetical protein